MTKKIIFSAGGTGGHVLPAINLIKHFETKGYEVILVTDSRGKNFVNNYSKIKTYYLNTDTPTNKNFFKKLLSIFVIFYSIIKSAIIMKKEKPDLIFGLGGYVAFPICFVSKFFNVPLAIYENNMILGRTNKILSFFSKRIFVEKKIKIKFPEKYFKKTREVGPIIDKKIINRTYSEQRNDNKKFSILILGGSQGAEIFGKIIPPTIKLIKENGHEIEIIQQCLPNQKNSLINFYNNNGIKNNIFEFHSNILNLILKADLAITRCGASTTAELAYSLTPFIAIPLPNSIDNHQYLNGKYYEEMGCCWFIKQEDLYVKNLSNLIVEIINNKNKLENIKANMKKILKKNVYENLENELGEFI